ncbi:MAG: GNAT family N-acetyltransferase [Oscillospiraceae bacterium]|jgi:RimJ/RimL family protein N-acetyltransferase|nr:GNAT family N-acetyltransferase [Oscillospiraceae bacterium]
MKFRKLFAFIWASGYLINMLLSSFVLAMEPPKIIPTVTKIFAQSSLEEKIPISSIIPRIFVQPSLKESSQLVIENICKELAKKLGITVEEFLNRLPLYKVKNPSEEAAKRLEIPIEEFLRLLSYNSDKESISLKPMTNTPDTWALWMDLFHNADPEYMKNYAEGALRKVEEIREDYFLRLYRNWFSEKPQSLAFTIFYSEDCNSPQKLIGRVTVGSLLFWSNNDLTEIGYVLLQKYQGRGIMTKAVEMVLNFLRFLIKQRIYCFETIRLTIRKPNIASQRVAEKNGFVSEKNEITRWGSPTLDFRLNLKERAQD